MLCVLLVVVPSSAVVRTVYPSNQFISLWMIAFQGCLEKACYERPHVSLCPSESMPFEMEHTPFLPRAAEIRKRYMLWFERDFPSSPRLVVPPHCLCAPILRFESLLCIHVGRKPTRARQTSGLWGLSFTMSRAVPL